MFTNANYITKITFQSQLPREQALATMKDRMPAFSQPGGSDPEVLRRSRRPYVLLTNLLFRIQKDAMDAFLKMPLKQGIATACKTTGQTLDPYPASAFSRCTRSEKSEWRLNFMQALDLKVVGG